MVVLDPIKPPTGFDCTPTRKALDKSRKCDWGWAREPRTPLVIPRNFQTGRARRSADKDRATPSRRPGRSLLTRWSAR